MPNDKKAILKEFLKEEFIKEIHKCYKEGCSLVDMAERCWNATFGAKMTFIKLRAKWYVDLGGCIDDFFPIVIMPPDYSRFRMPLRLRHYKRMKLICENFLDWLYER